ncbi:CDP-alcohol phosphatidyltransferase family protein [Martelella lutilitoris]|uniref:CDP-alcohol phosphatidyltransferase family protein n=1 Tax=Martelella lutilitoris TaxID=2583532 RepID=A0A5C4JWM2_9HYPH|nr:CDP-alcohol phosphatidyltransferase family protein [Martelella lutilitoris]TNB49654.1 CDP-alcohol phosphatidyltransferase family protein [Martelella lutilitoris]
MSTLEPPTSGRPYLRHFRLPVQEGSEERAQSRERRLIKSTLTTLSAIYLVSIAAFIVLAERLATGPDAVVASALTLLVIFALVVHALPGHDHARFGPANIITAIRAAMVSFFGAAMFFGNLSETIELYALVILVVSALALDGVDGHLARRTRLQSALGTRFDMEVDAFLILLLSVAAFLLGKAGIWVLAIGSMRYGFVLAQLGLPFLKAPLPPSFRRKVICVIQVAALCVLLLPIIAPPVSTAVAAIALLLITYSFGVDIVHLARRRHRPS